jgi:hypothetical protein
MSRLAVLTGVLLALAGLPSAALAADASFSGSAITSPANGADEFWNQDNGTGAVSVTGTVTDPTTTAKGDIVCYSPEAPPAKLLGPISVSSGSFSADVDLQGAFGEACRLLMVPDSAGAFPGQGSDLSAYSGPAISIADQFSHSGAGNLYGYYIESGSLQWSWGLQSLGECPVTASYDTDPSTLFFTQLFAGNACLPWESGIEPNLDSRSALQIDGLNAYVPGDLDQPSNKTGPNLTGDNGFQPLAYAPTFGPGHTSVSIAETDVPTICAAPGTFPPTTASCPSLSYSGIVVNQTTSLARDDQVARVQQTFTNFSSRAHTLDLLISQSVIAPESGEQPGFEFPGQTTVAAHAQPDSFAEFPGGPDSIIVVGDATAAPTEGNPVGAITYSQPPQSVNFVSGSGSQTAVFTMHYVATLAPGASTTYNWAFSEASSSAGLQRLEPLERDGLMHPTISFVSPAPRTVSPTAMVTVRGRASDAIALYSVSVDGTPLRLGPGGTWSTKVRLHPGRNQIVASATNVGGITTTASENVTYRIECVVPKLRGDTLKRARAALRRGRCEAGVIVRVRSRGVRKGRVVKSNPRAGKTRAVDTKVRLFVSRGRS